MAWSHVGSKSGLGTSANPALTHEVTILSGDLVMLFITSNGGTIDSITSGGGTWTEEANIDSPSQSANYAFFTKTANGSEPSSYDVTFNTSRGYQMFVRVFRAGTGTFAVDDAVQTGDSASTALRITCEAIDGAVISNDALSVVFGGKDNADTSPEDYTTADNSYTGVIGNSGTHMAASAYRIYGPSDGTTFSGSVTISLAGGDDERNDTTYGAHMSWVETGGGTTIEIPTGPLR